MTCLHAFSGKKTVQFKMNFYFRNQAKDIPKQTAKQTNTNQNLSFGDVHSNIQNIFGAFLLVPKTFFTFLLVWFRCRSKKKKN